MRRLGGILAILFGAAALLSAASQADIAPARQYGTTLAPCGASKVRMAGEVVKIRVEKEQALFHATFHMENAGAEAVALDVGFPDAVQASMWSSDVHEPPQGAGLTLRNFEVLVDGERVATEPRYYQSDVDPLERTELAESYRARERAIAMETDPAEKARLEAALEKDREGFGWWSGIGWLVWPMSFEPDQQRTVTVRYDLPYRGPYRHQLLGFKAVEYVLKSGAFWDGPIGSVVVEIELAEELTHGHLQVLKPGGFEETENGFRFEADSLEPTEDVEMVLTDFVDLADAVRGYQERAQQQDGDAAAVGEAWCLCAAWEAAEQLPPSAVEVDLARRILAYERKVLSSGEKVFTNHPKVRRDIRAAYVPWEWRLVQSLERNGMAVEARQAAREALPMLRWWLDDESGRNLNWGRVPVAMLKEAIAHCEGLIDAD